VPKFLAIWRPAVLLVLALLLLISLAGPVSAAQETICGRVDEVTQDTATVDGQLIPLAGLDADARAGLELAFNGNLDACVEVEVTNGTVTQALGVQVSAALCGNVDPAPGTDVLVDRVLIPPELLDAGTFQALRFAVSANGSACLYIDVAGSGGTSTVDVHLDMEVCATVTEVGAQTVALNGVTFDVAADADLNVEVGDVICVFMSTSADGTGIEVMQRTDEPDEPDEDGNGSGGGGDGDDQGGGGTGGGEVPDTALPFQP
jgi:hypothetical protein